MRHNHIVVKNYVFIHKIVSTVYSSKLALELQNTMADEPIGSVCVSPALLDQSALFMFFCAPEP